MKKILALFDGAHLSENTLEFVNNIHQSENVLLTGLFLPSVDYTNILLTYAGGMAGPLFLSSLDTDPGDIERNIKAFIQYCVKNGIEHRVHDVVNSSVREAIAVESLYSDLMILDGESFYNNLGELTQEEYTNDALKKAACPVVIVPGKYAGVENLVVAYDGSKESVFALKQFTYLFPQLCDLPTVVVYASDKNDDIPDLAFMEELCGRHYTDLTFYKLEADPKHYFNTWLMNKGKSLVISGSYSGTAIFRKHFAEGLVRDHKLPVFIAHE